MSLLGWPFLVTTASAAIIAVVLCLVLWSRVRGPGVLRALQRVLLIAACQVSVVLVLAVALNDQNYFYGSWSDLLGSVGPGATSSPPGAGPSPPVAATVRATRWQPSLRWPYPTTQRAAHGSLVEGTITGARTGLHTTAYVYLPPQYFAAGSAKRLPAVMVMTGYPGDAANLPFRQHYPGLLQAEIDAHRSNPMVLVMVDPAVVLPRDTECTDVPGGPQVLTFLGDDIPLAVSSTLHVRPVGWASMGDSTGGYCAVKLAMFEPGMFPVAVSLSGYYHTLRDATTGDLWGGSTLLRRLNEPVWRLHHLPAPPVAVLASVGSDEGGRLGVKETNLFVAAVKAPMLVRKVVVRGGGHNFADWAQVVGPGLDFASARLGA